LGVFRKAADPLAETALHRMARRQGPWQRFSAGELAWSDQGGKLDQRKRVATGRLDQAGSHLGWNGDVNELSEQLSTGLRV
jgi:hypothetical protein